MYKQLGMAALAGMAAYGLRNPKYQLVHSDGEARWADLRIFRADDGQHIVHVAGAPVASGYYDFPSDCFWISPEGGGAQKCFKTLSDIAAHYRQTKGRSARARRSGQSWRAHYSFPARSGRPRDEVRFGLEDSGKTFYYRRR